MKKKIALVICICAVFVLLLYFIPPVVNMRPSDIKDLVTHESSDENGEEMDITSSESEVAESGSMKMYFDPSSLKLRLSDKKNGIEWTSYMKGFEGEEAALLTVNYLGEDSNIYMWDSDTNCRALSSYTVSKLANGVKVVMDLNEGEANRFYEALPKKMSIEEYEDLFMKGLDDALAAGTITEEEHKRYKTTLSLVYRKSIMEECYAVTYNGNPPASATEQMIKLARLVGYTSDMLMADADKFDFTVSKTEVPEFSITMFITLDDNGQLIVRVPSDLMKSYNDYFTVQNVEVLPNFGAVTAKEMKEGYLLVPDGSGALMKMNTYKSGVPDYKRAVYDNDHYSNYYFAPEFSENISMPVFGMTYGELDKARQGFFAIIEKGAETAYINTKLAGEGDDGAADNKIYASFDTDQYSRVSVDGPYKEGSATYLVDTGMNTCDYTIRYMFYGRGVTYYDMAESCRNYIAEKNGISLAYDKDNGSLYLDVIGALTTEKRILGIPYKSTSSMTTYKELGSILDSLKDMPLTACYKGVFNGGMNNKVNNRADLTAANGSRKDLQNVLKKAEANGDRLYLDTTLSRVYRGGNSYRENTHALKDFADNPVNIFRYDPVTGYLKGYKDSTADSYEILSPYYLINSAASFNKKASAYSRLGISDLGNLAYADYDNQDMVDPFTASAVTDNVMKLLKEGRELTISDAFMKYIPYAEIVPDVSRDSSEYATFAYTIPMRQLIMNGLCEYTTENINMSSRDPEYYILEAAELHALPKFTVMDESEAVLKNTSYDYLYSMDFGNLQDTIKNVEKECADIFTKIGSSEITDHRIITDGVFETTYGNGTKVMVNYNLTEASLPDGSTMTPESYVIFDENGDRVE